MRDIRGDLQDRAGLLEEQINAHEAQFDKLLEQLKQEHDARLEDLKAELEAVNRLIEVELRRLATAPAAPKVPAREPVQYHAEPPGGATCRPSARAGTACVTPAAGSVAGSARAAAVRLPGAQAQRGRRHVA